MGARRSCSSVLRTAEPCGGVGGGPLKPARASHEDPRHEASLALVHAPVELRDDRRHPLQPAQIDSARKTSGTPTEVEMPSAAKRSVF